MKNNIVFVCMGENPDDGDYVSAVYSTLEEAQRHMRMAFQSYKKEYPSASVEWNAGAITGHWGWFDVDSRNGFYISAQNVLGYYGEEMV